VTRVAASVPTTGTGSGTFADRLVAAQLGSFEVVAA
jgi:hypothetical protein